jgi:hypothetical protein
MTRAIKIVLVGTVAAVVLGMVAGPAFATSGGARPPKGNNFHRSHPTVQGATVLRGAGSSSSVAGSALPFTGAQLTLVTAIGLLTIAAGSGLVLRSRRMGWRRALNP